MGKIRFLCGVAAYFCMVVPAFAWDADPKSFRADPQAWVRNVLMPGCKLPVDAATTSQCNCMVRILKERMTEADVLRVNGELS
jgi:hypothetical protein